jgi:hypothetical protein
MTQFLKIVVSFIIIVLGFFFENPIAKKHLNSHQIVVYNLLKGNRTIIIFIDESFSEKERIIFSNTLKYFNAFGLKVFLVSNRNDFYHIEIINAKNLGRNVAGLYPVESNQIYINVNAITTESQLQAVFMHEVSHWIGLGHICLDYQTTNEQLCSPVGRGFAIMNHVVSTPNTEVSFSNLDILEFKRIESMLIH